MKMFHLEQEPYQKILSKKLLKIKMKFLQKTPEKLRRRKYLVKNSLQSEKIESKMIKRS